VTWFRKAAEQGQGVQKDAPTDIPPAPTIDVAPKTVPDDPDALLWNEVKASG